MAIHFSHVLKNVWIFASRGIFKKPIWMNVWVFPYFSRLMGIHFSHVLGTVWISASRKLCKKPLTLEWSVFPYFSRTVGIHFPHVLGTILQYLTKTRNEPKQAENSQHQSKRLETNWNEPKNSKTTRNDPNFKIGKIWNFLLTIVFQTSSPSAQI